MDSEDSIALDRPFKKRKVFRARARRDFDAESADQDAPAQAVLTTAEETKHPIKSEGPTTIARPQRPNGRVRKAGIGFSVADSRSQPSREIDPQSEDDQPPERAMDAYATRFTKQSGAIGLKNQDEDKHMSVSCPSFAELFYGARTNAVRLAFIDSKLGIAGLGKIPLEIYEPHATQRPPPQPSNPQSVSAQLELDRNPTGLGKLQEIDLGDEAVQRNLQRTQVATQKYGDGQAVNGQGSVLSAKPKQTRLGRDGKPFRPRKRRGSDDLARDALVESLLQEHRVEVFAPTPTTNKQGEGDSAGDEAFAEEFKRNYMAEQSSRIRPPPKKPVGKGAASKVEEARGPKLGGSRNARAVEAARRAAEAGKK